MLKTMKYEIIRNKLTLIILASILGAAELVFLFGIIGDNTRFVGYGILLLVLGTSVVYFAIWLLGLMSYSHDLRDKTGYMVFLTPISTYKIIFSKILVGLFELIISAILFIILAGIDLKILLSKYSSEASIVEAAARILNTSTDDIMAAFFSFVVSLVFSVLMFYSFAYLAASISALLSRKNGVQRVYSVVIIIIMLIIHSGINKALPKLDANTGSIFINNMIENIPSYILSLFFAAICTFACGYLLDKKISL